jgi:hypothetical protein
MEASICGIILREIHAMTTEFPTVYATSDEGLRLPVVDVTNPAFTVSATGAELDALADQFVRETANRPELPPPVRAALAQSILGKALIAAAGGFLPGMDTYLLKLGPDHLTDPFTDIDRRIAASFPGFTTRIRLQDMAKLLADGATRQLEASPGRPLCLINIAGGPAADSWNALIHLRCARPLLLENRVISIAVLDLDDRGPRFGARAVAALTAAPGPLQGLSIDVRHVVYDWAHPDRLAALLDELGTREAACAISSEGGLFEYAQDEVAVTNLAALRAATPADAIVVGSVTREGAPARASLAASRVPTRPRTLASFVHLARAGGWALDTAIERPFTYDVRLVTAAANRPA